MHVLLINNSSIPVYAYGGTERVIWDLGAELVRRGHRVSYLVPGGSRCDFAAVLRQSRFKPLASASALVAGLEAECVLKEGSRAAMGFV